MELVVGCIACVDNAVWLYDYEICACESDTAYNDDRKRYYRRGGNASRECNQYDNGHYERYSNALRDFYRYGVPNMFQDRMVENAKKNRATATNAAPRPSPKTTPKAVWARLVLPMVSVTAPT